MSTDTCTVDWEIDRRRLRPATTSLSRIAHMKNKAKGDGDKPSARHDATHVVPTGQGAAAAKAPRRAKSTLWDLSLDVPKAVPRSLGATKALDPAIAAALELESAKAMRKLRRKLAELCQKHGMKSPIRALTLERWRWAAKWEEDEAAANLPKGANGATHPVIPRHPAPNADHELVLELERQGLSKQAARATVDAVRATSTEAASELLKMRHQAASGKPLPAPPLAVKVNRHSIDLVSGRAQVKLSRAAYGKLAILHRRHAGAAEASAPPSEEMVEAASGEAEHAEAACAERAAADEDGDSRSALHLRLLAMLTRYKSLQGHGFQAAIGKPVWQLLTSRLGVACEGFASPLNAYLPVRRPAEPHARRPRPPLPAAPRPSRRRAGQRMRAPPVLAAASYPEDWPTPALCRPSARPLRTRMACSALVVRSSRSRPRQDLMRYEILPGSYSAVLPRCPTKATRRRCSLLTPCRLSTAVGPTVATRRSTHPSCTP